jgi:outer membrane protein assembly factor BamE (lipoprotein component of BamABCDE complex)
MRRPSALGRNRAHRSIRMAVALGLAVSLSGCFTATYQRGYILDEAALAQVPQGSSQEQVLLVLGTPSTVATVSGETFYYISQKSQRTAFLNPEITDQRVLAVYFDQTRRVEHVANYGMQDGKVFDFISRTTPTGGQESNIIKQILSSSTFTPKLPQ